MRPVSYIVLRGVQLLLSVAGNNGLVRQVHHTSFGNIGGCSGGCWGLRSRTWSQV